MSSGDMNQAEAERRVRAGCERIESAFRLAHHISAQETLDAVRAAMIRGARMAADDVEEEVGRAK